MCKYPESKLLPLTDRPERSSLRLYAHATRTAPWNPSSEDPHPASGELRGQRVLVAAHGDPGGSRHGQGADPVQAEPALGQRPEAGPLLLPELLPGEVQAPDAVRVDAVQAVPEPRVHLRQIRKDPSFAHLLPHPGKQDAGHDLNVRFGNALEVAPAHLHAHEGGSQKALEHAV